jgi:hypothetical protein
MAFTLTTAMKNTLLDQITSAAGSTATVKIYSGSVPANADASNLGTLLVSLPCSNPFAPASSGGILTASAITQTNASQSGTAAFYRLMASNGSTVLAQGLVNTTGAEMNLNTTAIVSGGPCVITSLTISM